jgi:hypothetical protein
MQKCIAADLRYKTLNTFMEKEEICRSLKLVQHYFFQFLETHQSTHISKASSIRMHSNLQEGSLPFISAYGPHTKF